MNTTRRPVVGGGRERERERERRRRRVLRIASSTAEWDVHTSANRNLQWSCKTLFPKRNTEEKYPSYNKCQHKAIAMHLPPSIPKRNKEEIDIISPSYDSPTPKKGTS